MDKYKKEAIRGIQSHDQRERKSHSNPDIDYDRSKLNYDLHNEQPVKFLEKAQSRIDEMLFTKAVRKDAVYMCGIIVSSDQQFFKGLSEWETKCFFKDSYNFLCKYVGKENVISAAVHLDEKTPHMHFMHVPIAKDKTLSAKKIYTRESLRSLQSEYAQYMQLHRHGIKRGVRQDKGAAKKHLDTREFKQQMEALNQVKDEVKELETRQSELQSEIKAAQNECRAIAKELADYTAIAEAAKQTKAYQAVLTKPSLTNSRKVYDEAQQIISVQQDALTNKELVEKENKELKAQNTLLVKDYRTISGREWGYQDAIRELKGELANAAKRYQTLQDENTKLKEVINEKQQFIEQPQIRELYQEYMRPKKIEQDNETKSPDPFKPREAVKRSSGFER